MEQILALIEKVINWIEGHPSVAKQVFLPDPPQNAPVTLPEPSPALQPSMPPKPATAPNPANPDVLAPDWSIQANAHHNVRVLCDLTGVTAMPPIVIDGKAWNRKDIMTACVRVESNFLIHATHPNYLFHHDGTKYLASTDFGICQWNDYYHSSEITPDEAMNNPEKAVRLMCKYWLAGQERQWVSYTGGAFKQYLGKV